MITLLIGHRGTGKSSFLELLRKRAREFGISASFYDLDQELEARTGQSIHALFGEGESSFRRREKKTFDDLISQVGALGFIALGAGFEGPIPAKSHVIWLRRETDAAGRIFLGRPRLEPEMSPLEEYQLRHAIREHRFRAWAHEQLLMPEGYEGGLEDFVLSPHRLHVPYDFTLKPEHFRDWEGFVEKRSTWGIRRFELRDDLLSETQIKIACDKLPVEKTLFSVRRAPARMPKGEVDWALELGLPPVDSKILSRHELDGSFQNTLKNFTAGKLAIEVRNFTELQIGHDWWLADPGRRSFLPRSKDGRWRWYRSLFGPRMPIHFYREDEGSAPDQPTLGQTLLQPSFKENFAAVLGSPVSHSRSPEEHRAFFKDRQRPFVAIDVAEQEFAGALNFLMRLGLSEAAVTAPLKHAAFEVCERLTPEASQLRAVNTLRIKEGRIEGHNTDVLALNEIAKELKGEVWLWGGSGVRSSVRMAFPGVKEFSARTGLPRPGTTDVNAPAVLIWAVGRTTEFTWPPESVKTGLILDLNYADNSPGLEWAATHNLPYQSGLKMFKLQAEFQRRYWQESHY